MSKKKPNRAVEDAGDDLPVSDAPLTSDAPPPDPYEESADDEEATAPVATTTDSLGETVVPMGDVTNAPSPTAPGEVDAAVAPTASVEPDAKAGSPVEPQMLAGSPRVSPDLKTQLETLQGGDLTVEEFSERLQLAESARAHLDYLASYGYVTRTWRNSKGRYGLTEKGRETLASC